MPSLFLHFLLPVSVTQVHKVPLLAFRREFYPVLQPKLQRWIHLFLSIEELVRPNWLNARINCLVALWIQLRGTQHGIPLQRRLITEGGCHGTRLIFSSTLISSHSRCFSHFFPNTPWSFEEQLYCTTNLCRLFIPFLMSLLSAPLCVSLSPF